MVQRQPELVGATEGFGQEPLVRRVLITGAGGQLGTDISLLADGRNDIELIAFDRSMLDITSDVDVISTVGAKNPDVIIHAAAYTAVDDCESNQEHAYAVNGAGTANVVAAARNIGARVIYLSTDYVFDGTQPEPYVETDTPRPASVYGASKLVGENAIAELGGNGLVVRTSWVSGIHGANMVKTILRAAQNHPMLTFVDDQIGKPTFTSDLAESLLQLAVRDDSGIMHVTNEGVVSWFEFCQDVLEFAGLGRDRVQPCATRELQPPRPAPRPANSVLANTRYSDLGLDLLRDYREPLKEVIRDLTF